MKINKIATAIGLTLALSATANAGVLPDSQKQNDWYSAAETKLTEKEAAAQAWQVPVTEIATEAGTLKHEASDKSANYGEMASAAAQISACLSLRFSSAAMLIA